MKNKKVFLSMKQGSILAYSLIILAMMLAIATSISISSILTKKGASATQFSAQALQTADSGVQWALKIINSSPSSKINDPVNFPDPECKMVGGVPTVANQPYPVAGATYSLSFYGADGLAPVSACDSPVSDIGMIKSIGTYNNTVRAVNVAVAAAKKPVGWWKMDDGSGMTAVDSSDNGNSGTLFNGPAWTTRKIGGALSFDGINDYVNVPYNSIFDITDAVTLSAWFKKDVGSGTEAWIVHKAPVNSSYAMFFEGGVFKMRLMKPAVQDCNIAPPTEGTWHHAVTTYDGVNMKVYIDGTLLNTCPATGAISKYTGPGPLLGIDIGAFNNGTGYQFKGQIADVKIFDKALNASEVMAEYNKYK